jgi:hypothetical protein
VAITGGNIFSSTPSVTAPDLDYYPGDHEDYQEYYDVEYYLLGFHGLAWDVEVYIFDGWGLQAPEVGLIIEKGGIRGRLDSDEGWI